MPRRVSMVAEIIGDNCTGCRLCEQVCPTVAITMRKRKEGETGPGKNIAVMHDEHCYNIQACLEICPDEAIVMRELDEPFDVDVDVSSVDQGEMVALCKKAGLPPGMVVCPCTTTTAAELAAAVLKGASTPDKLSRMTGVRTGCSELCLQPMFDILAAGGHTEMERNPRSGFQWYGRAGDLFSVMQPDGTFSEEIEEKFKVYQPTRELKELAEANRARKAAKAERAKQ